MPSQWLCFWGKSTNETNQYQILCYLNKYSKLSGSRLLINIKQREAEFNLDTRSITPYAVYSMKCLKTIYIGTKFRGFNNCLKFKTNAHLREKFQQIQKVYNVKGKSLSFLIPGQPVHYLVVNIINCCLYMLPETSMHIQLYVYVS